MKKGEMCSGEQYSRLSVSKSLFFQGDHTATCVSQERIGDHGLSVCSSCPLSIQSSAEEFSAEKGPPGSLTDSIWSHADAGWLNRPNWPLGIC